MAEVVIDASAVVDLLVDTRRAVGVAAALGESALVAPAHMPAEVFNAVGRLRRAGAVDDDGAGKAVERLAGLPVESVPIQALLSDAWRLRGRVQLLDALYVALADRRGVPLVTSDRGQAQATPRAVLIGGDESRAPGSPE